MAIAAAGHARPQSTFHGNSARTGVYEKPGPAVLTGVKWAFKAGGTVYVGSWDSYLYALDAETGQAAWEFRTDGSKADPLKVLNPDGSLNQEAFAPLFGDFADMYLDFNRFVSVGAILSSPVVDRGIVYVGSMDGKLYAIQ